MSSQASQGVAARPLPESSLLKGFRPPASDRRDQNHEKNDGCSHQQGATDRPFEERDRIAPGQQHRPAQRLLEHGAEHEAECQRRSLAADLDRKSTRLNSSHANNSYAVFCLTKDLNSSMVLECSSELTITCIAEALGLSTGLTSSREIGKA